MIYFEPTEEIEFWDLNYMLKVRIESNVKLNVINWQGESMIDPEDFDKPEVHFMQVEWIVH